MKSFTQDVLKSDRRVFLLIVLCGLAAYFNALGNPFKTMDDFNSIVANTRIRDVRYIDDLFTSSFFGGGAYYRPLVYVSFMIEYHLFGLRPFFYNLTNILIHILNAIGVFVLAKRVLGQRAAALAVSLVFVLHPVHAEAVANIPGRSILLCAFFFIYAFLFYMKSLQRPKSSAVAFVLSVVFFVMALCSKESAIVLPAVLAAYAYFFGNKEQKIARHVPALVVFCAVAGLYLAVRQALDITKVYSWLSFREAVLGVSTFLSACFHFAQILVFPKDLYYDHSTALFTSFADPRLWLTWAAWAAIVALIAVNRKRFTPPVAFFAGWIAINLVTVSQAVPVRTSATHISSADHFLYLPSVGVFVLLTLGAQRIFDWARQKNMTTPDFAAMFTAGICLFFFLVTVQQNIYARDEIALYKRTLAHNPNNSRVRNSLATAYAKLGNFEEAEVHYRKAIKLDPWMNRAHIGLGTALAEQGRYWESIEAYEKVVDPGPLAEMTEKNIKLSYRNIIDRYLARLPGEPDNPDLLYSLGVAYGKSGNIDKGIEYYKQALALAPDHKNAVFNLASSMALQKRWKDAIRYYERVLTMSGEKDELDMLAYSNLGQIYKELGNVEQAQMYFKLSEQLNDSLKAGEED